MSEGILETTLTDSEVLSKTIYTTFDEVSRMKDFCSDKDENGVRIVSKNFYDWYLKEDTFFIPYGVFIMEGLFSHESKQKFVCVFNFEDANCSKFEIINYLTQKSVIVFFFYREHNLDMNKIKVHIKELHSQNLDLIAAFNPPEDLQDYYKIVRERFAKIKKEAKTKIKGENKQQRRRDIDKRVREIDMKLHDVVCSNVTQWIYATMYFSAKHQPEIVEYIPGQNETGETKTVNSKYVYSGYINLNAPTYRPTIKKDPSEPTREYQRHIEKWTVRGHYRRTSKGLIWIEPHTKGEGELEKRIYGTEDESQVNVLPKIFEVEKKVPVDVITPVSEPVSTPVPKTNTPAPNIIPKEKTFYEKVRGWGFFILKFLKRKHHYENEK